MEIAKRNIDVKKLVICKLILPHYATNSGYMPADDLRIAVDKARETFGWFAGVVDWVENYLHNHCIKKRFKKVIVISSVIQNTSILRGFKCPHTIIQVPSPDICGR